MGWQTISGVTGKVYCPEATGQTQKHPCRDCFGCQHCSEERCRICRFSNNSAFACRTAPKEDEI